MQKLVAEGLSPFTVAVYVTHCFNGMSLHRPPDRKQRWYTLATPTSVQTVPLFSLARCYGLINSKRFTAERLFPRKRETITPDFNGVVTSMSTCLSSMHSYWRVCLPDIGTGVCLPDIGTGVSVCKCVCLEDVPVTETGEMKIKDFDCSSFV